MAYNKRKMRLAAPFILGLVATSSVSIDAHEPNKPQFVAAQRSQDDPSKQIAAPARQSPPEQVGAGGKTNGVALPAAKEDLFGELSDEAKEVSKVVLGSDGLRFCGQNQTRQTVGLGRRW